jgi:hypothetical protein
MSYFDNIEHIMSNIEGWIADNTIHYPAPPGMLARSPIVPGIMEFHHQNQDLKDNINKWSKEILPTLSYTESVEQISKLKKLLEPNSGRDLYLFPFIVDQIDPSQLNKFISGMFGGALIDKIQTHIFSDPDCSYTKESYFTFAYRRMFPDFMKSPIVSLFLFLRMLKTKRSDVVLTNSDDFCVMYDGMVVKDSDKYEIKGLQNDFFFSFKKVIIDEKIFNFVNNPKNVFEITKGIYEKFESDHDIEYVGHYLESMINKIENKSITVTI